jgi:hypothetical protein
MGACFSKSHTGRSQSRSSGRASQPPQSDRETNELRQGTQGLSPPVPPPRGPNASLVPANSVQFDQSIPSSKPPTRSGRSTHVSRNLPRPASAYDSAGAGVWPASEGETSRKPLPKSDRHSRSKSFSAVAARNSAGDGAISKAGKHRDRSGIDMALNRRAGPRAAVKRSSTRGNTTVPFVPTVREVLPEGFRYVLRP